MSTVLAVVVGASDVKAKNPIIPETKEIVWAVVAFVIVFAVLAWKAWPAIKKALADREAKIRGDLEAAEHARQAAERELAEYRAQLADARAEAGRIVDEARQAADQVRKDLIKRAEADAAEVRARAQEDVRLAADRAMADLRTRVSEVSIELAERIVQRSLDHDTQIALIEEYINEVGSVGR